MKLSRALRLALQLCDAEIKRLAPAANLHEVYRLDSPTVVQAARRRRELIVAMELIARHKQGIARDLP